MIEFYLIFYLFISPKIDLFLHEYLKIFETWKTIYVSSSEWCLVLFFLMIKIMIILYFEPFIFCKYIFCILNNNDNLEIYFDDNGVSCQMFYLQ